MEDKYNINVKQYVVYLTSRKARMVGNMTMYKYKNIW